MKKLDCFDRKSLKNAAYHLISQGFSVIPVHGDSHSTNPKKPATSWRKFQKQLASPAEIDEWFDKNITGIGIVCGQVSKLLVIDFDDEYTYRQFTKRFPQYVDTFTVKTKRGYHLYYEIDQYIPTFKFIGGDIKAEKSFVITSPSMINGYVYKTIKSNNRKTLNPADADLILNYFQITSNTKTLNQQNNTVDITNLINIYDRLMPQIGRNNALYRTASIARSFSIQQKHAEDVLIPHHIKQPAPIDHKHESLDNRFYEATRTITSAYHNHSITYSKSRGLPNSIRESLLQIQHSTILSRVLDIMMLNDWKPGNYFSMSQLIQLTKQYGMNHKSVLSVLTGDLAIINGQWIIYREYVEYPDIYGLNSLQGGRPIEFIYRVPSTHDLLKVLDVKQTPSDLITENDVKTAHAYRLALHREYIKRESPEVPLWCLAKRLGVSIRTIQRFNTELNVQKTQNFAFFTLSKSNLDSLPKRTSKTSKNTTNGFWLESQNGTRYPAWRHVGSHLLKDQVDEIRVVVQKPSKLNLDTCKSSSQSDVVWRSITPEQFVKLQVFREYATEQPSVQVAVNRLFQYVKARVNRVRYYDMQLHFDSVISHIAKDKVAETISGYLYAYDSNGEVVKRPARRGIAFRMLKEFGNGNVYLALLDSHTEMFFTLARHALRFKQVPAAMKFLLSALD